MARLPLRAALVLLAFLDPTLALTTPETCERGLSAAGAHPTSRGGRHGERGHARVASVAKAPSPPPPPLKPLPSMHIQPIAAASVHTCR
jgi:hypothetical protein